jgi:hypothetical protein
MGNFRKRVFAFINAFEGLHEEKLLINNRIHRTKISSSFLLG